VKLASGHGKEREIEAQYSGLTRLFTTAVASIMSLDWPMRAGIFAPPFPSPVLGQKRGVVPVFAVHHARLAAAREADGVGTVVPTAAVAGRRVPGSIGDDVPSD